MKNILTVTSIIEFPTAAILLVFPSLIARLLFGATLDTPIALIVARVAGAAILSLAVACWFARKDGINSAANGLVVAMLLYNISITLILIYAALGLSLLGFGLWPITLIHMAMSVWCIINLLKKTANN
jgi:hypothetical protein